MIVAALVAGWMLARDDGEPPRPSTSHSSTRGAVAERAARALAQPRARATVERIVDGDTVVVRFRDDAGEGRVTVRYLGVNTPEVARGGKPGQCYGREATAANASWVADRRVRLRFDRELVDRYGRLLAALHPDGWDRSVSERLVADGYARVMTIRPNGMLAPRLDRLAAEARRAGRGLWSACGDRLPSGQ